MSTLQVSDMLLDGYVTLFHQLAPQDQVTRLDISKAGKQKPE